jgi:hypothetical protein
MTQADILHIRDLQPGDKFSVLGVDLPLTLVRLGLGSAIVRGRSETRSFESRDGELVEFVAPGRVYTISLGTLVEPAP